ncbi:MAG: FAD-binding domain-containing protein [Candidatus Magasanikbacteria bacterium]
MNTAPRACSRLSTHLAWGTVSLREVYHKTKDRIKELKTEESKKAGEWTRSLKMFLSRLYWHDHFIQKLEDEPEIEFKPMNKAFSEERIPYKKDKGKIKKWLKGKTGYPLVDACMKCFKKTGFLNFRMRAMIVSFACHVLHISWKEIKYPMARLMADYIPGIHIPQLQMQAGITGINSIRCYNPTKQTKENDPKCSFIKKWIPKMKNYTPSEIINHPEEGLFEIENYPNPIVNYREKRNEMLSALYKIKNSSAAKKETEKVYKKHGSRRRKNQKSN